MAFIEASWFLWLALTLGFGGAAFALQLRNIRNIGQIGVRALNDMASAGGSGDVEGLVRGVGRAHAGFVQKFIPVIICSAIASISSLVLLLSVILNIISHVNGG
jgi:nitrate/nitrite transporter NarK